MMTRHTPPTRGDALVMGHSIRTDFEGAAKCMGVVTQVHTHYDQKSQIGEQTTHNGKRYKDTSFACAVIS
jgi:ABC-type multidrug transport system ATPase subunit